MATISMKNLLESGVHFGHQTRRWDPRMAPYIFTARNGIHIIDLQKTVMLAKECFEALRDFSEKGNKILFVGTKKQAKQSIEDEAKRCGMYYVSQRWLGGLLTNFQTVKKSINRMKMLEEIAEKDEWDRLAKTKKERLGLERELAKLQKNLSGIRDMERVPKGMVVIDPQREHIAIAEAKKIGMTIFGVIDTNCNPEEIDYPIPGNDDAIRAISLFLNILAEAIIEGSGQESVEPEGLSIVESEEEENTEELSGENSGESAGAESSELSSGVSENDAAAQENVESGTEQSETTTDTPAEAESVQQTDGAAQE